MILVMGSNVKTREVLVELIREKGHLAVAIECGEEVLIRMRFQRPSLVILDCDVKDSFELLEKIRAEGGAVRVPVVMYSESGANLKERALGKGADGFVVKGSLDWWEMVAEIGKWVRG